MGKSVLAILLCLVLLVGCGNLTTGRGTSGSEERAEVERNTEESASDTGITVVDNRGKEDLSSANVSDDDFEKKGYIYENAIGDSLYFMTVKNNSSADVSIEGNATAYDASGNVAGASQSSIEVLGKGETSIMSFYFDSVSGIDHVDYQLSYDTSLWYQPVIGGIKMEQTINDQNLTIVATNEGSVNAQFVEAYALFFDSDGKVVSYDSTYITDGDSELKPGATMSVQLDSYDSFDHVECYLTGRSNGEASAASGDISDSDFEVKEYGYENSIGDTLYFLVVKSNCEKAVTVDGNMTAYDASGSVIGAASGSIDVLGNGETSIASFYFSSVSGIDHVEYALTYSESSYYDPGVGDLEVVQSNNDQNVVVSVTNKGNEPVKFVEAHALFFDGSGKLVNHDSTFVTDNDSEIKPGATISKQLNIYGSYDTVECYFTGRKGGF